MKDLYDYVRENDMWTYYFGGSSARTHALMLCIGVVLGSTVPELGNLATYYLLPLAPHFFNKYFLLLGLLGLFVSYIALHRG